MLSRFASSTCCVSSSKHSGSQIRSWIFVVQLWRVLFITLSLLNIILSGNFVKKNWTHCTVLRFFPLSDPNFFRCLKILQEEHFIIKDSENTNDEIWAIFEIKRELGERKMFKCNVYVQKPVHLWKASLPGKLTSQTRWLLQVSTHHQFLVRVN